MLMLIRYVVICLCLVMFSGTVNITMAAASPDDAQNFIEHLSKDALAVIKSSESSGAKEEKLTKLFVGSVDTKWIAKFAMGKYWKEATEEQRNKYLELHKKFLLGSYIPKFREYTNQEIKITKSYKTDNANEYMVETKIVSNDGAAVNVDYKLRKNDSGKFVIFDVIAEGVSLITTQRSEFASILSRSGINALIEKLSSKG